MMIGVTEYMVVGSRVDVNVLRHKLRSVDDLKRYAEILVPRSFRHITKIIDNQKYLVAIELRNMKSIDFKKRHALADELIKDITISGTMNEIVYAEDLLQFADFNKIVRYLFKEELNT